MLIKKKDTTEILKQYTKLIEPLIGQECVLSFDMHNYGGIVISGLAPKTVGSLKNTPDKREFEGKSRSPLMFEIQTNQGNLIFLFDDTEVYPLVNGIRLVVQLDKPLNGNNAIEVDLRREG